MLRKILIYAMLLLSIFGYVNFFEWYLGNQKIFVEEALYLAYRASIPTYIMIFLIHMIYYPRNIDDRANVITFPPMIWLFSINTGFTIATLNMYHFQYYQIHNMFDFYRSWELGLFVFILGSSLIFPAIKKFNSIHEDPNPTSPTTNIIKTGIYKYSRNPMYLGLMLLQLSLGMLLSMIHIGIMTIFTYIIFKYYVIKPEEKYLLAKFGDEYDKYKSDVRRWI